MGGGTQHMIYHLAVPTLILLAGVVEDLRTRKVKNRVVLICMGIAVVSSFLGGGWNGLLVGTAGLLTAFLLHVPLVYARVLGAGDMKLMMAFGLSTHWQAVLTVSLFALLWGALLGLTRALISGRLLGLIQNTLKIGYDRASLDPGQLNQIPYTVALLFGWLSYVFKFHEVLV